MAASTPPQPYTPPTTPGPAPALAPGVRVKVTQQIAARNYTWLATTTGTIVEFRQKPTGSWFAHSKDDRLWLDRLVLRLDSGEVTVLSLDEYSIVEAAK